MRCVGVDVSAAIGAEHFHRDLRRHRTLHDILFGHGLLLHDRLPSSIDDRLPVFVHFRDGDLHRLDQSGFGVGLEVLNHALRHQEHGEHDADRDEQVISDADKIDPKVADGVGRMTRNSPNERSRDSDAQWRRTRNCETPARPSARSTTSWIRRRSSANWCWW